MRVTKFAHSCIRIESDSNSLVIDPGIFTTPDAVDGVDAILITHEHADHFSPELLQRAAAPVYTIAAVAAKLPTEWDVTVVAPGEEFHAAGVSITAVGEMHASPIPTFRGSSTPVSSSPPTRPGFTTQAIL